MPLDEYLDANGFGLAFREDHLYPMAAAIWSTPAAQIGRYPTEAFVRFCENHHLLTLGERPAWRTVSGGSREYVRRLAAALGGRVRTGAPRSRCGATSAALRS
jgi:predicted NAD/FAD-binding protein